MKYWPYYLLLALMIGTSIFFIVKKTNEIVQKDELAVTITSGSTAVTETKKADSGLRIVGITVPTISRELAMVSRQKPLFWYRQTISIQVTLIFRLRAKYGILAQRR